MSWFYNFKNKLKKRFNPKIKLRLWLIVKDKNEQNSTFVFFVRR